MNTIDRYNYNPTDVTSALNAFSVSRSSAAPELEPEKKGLTIRTNTRRKSLTEIKSEQRVAFVQAVVLVTAAVLALAMVSGVLFTFVQENELTKEISNIQTEINIAKSENISLNSQLESMVSISQIEDYAVNHLGMAKLQPSQIVYIDTSEFVLTYEGENSDTGT